MQKPLIRGSSAVAMALAILLVSTSCAAAQPAAQQAARPRGVENPRLRVVRPPRRPSPPRPPDTLPEPSGQTEHSILPDGRVQARHPDGRIVVYEADCGFTTFFPDGSSSSATCNQVQPADLPALPGDPALHAFLESHRDHLLQQISQLVDYRQEEVDLYLDYESEHSDALLQQIQMRMRLIDQLLQ